MVSCRAVAVTVIAVHGPWAVVRQAASVVLVLGSMFRLLAMVGSAIRLSRVMCMEEIDLYILGLLVVTRPECVLVKMALMAMDSLVVVSVIDLWEMCVLTSLLLARLGVNNLDNPFECKFNHYIN